MLQLIAWSIGWLIDQLFTWRLDQSCSSRRPCRTVCSRTWSPRCTSACTPAQPVTSSLRHQQLSVTSSGHVAGGRCGQRTPRLADPHSATCGWTDGKYWDKTFGIFEFCVTRRDFSRSVGHWIRGVFRGGLRLPAAFQSTIIFDNGTTVLGRLLFFSSRTSQFRHSLTKSFSFWGVCPPEG